MLSILLMFEITLFIYKLKDLNEHEKLLMYLLVPQYELMLLTCIVFTYKCTKNVYV